MTVPESEKAVISILRKSQVENPSQPFRSIMIYHHLQTEFCFVKPLLKNRDQDIVVELFKIFTSYGPPAVVYINSCSQEIVDSIDAQIRALCPMFNVQFVKNESDNYEVGKEIVARLQQWMKETPAQQWEVGCCVVQWEKNTAGPNPTPHHRFFKALRRNICTDDTNDAHNVETQSVPNVLREQVLIKQEGSRMCPVIFEDDL